MSSLSSTATHSSTNCAKISRAERGAVSAGGGTAEKVAEAAVEVSELAVEVEAIEAAVEGAIEAAVEGAIEAAVEEVIEAAVEGAIETAVEGAIETAVEGEIEVAVEGAIEAAVEGAIEATVEASIEEVVAVEVAEEEAAASLDKGTETAPRVSFILRRFLLSKDILPASSLCLSFLDLGGIATHSLGCQEAPQKLKNALNQAGSKIRT